MYANDNEIASQLQDEEDLYAREVMQLEKSLASKKRKGKKRGAKPKSKKPMEIIKEEPVEAVSSVHSQAAIDLRAEDRVQS